MKFDSISGAVLPTLGKYLNRVTRLAEVHVDLAVLPVNLAFTAHSSVPHIETMLDASALVPHLTANFHTQLRPDQFDEFLIRKRTIDNTSGAALMFQKCDGRGEVILDSQNGW